MNESTLHQVPCEEILHSIALDAHSCPPEPQDIPGSTPEQFATSDVQPGLVLTVNGHLCTRIGEPRMNDVHQYISARLRLMFQRGQSGTGKLFSPSVPKSQSQHQLSDMSHGRMFRNECVNSSESRPEDGLDVVFLADVSIPHHVVIP